MVYVGGATAAAALAAALPTPTLRKKLASGGGSGSSGASDAAGLPIRGTSGSGVAGSARGRGDVPHKGSGSLLASAPRAALDTSFDDFDVKLLSAAPTRVEPPASTLPSRSQPTRTPLQGPHTRGRTVSDDLDVDLTDVQSLQLLTFKGGAGDVPVESPETRDFAVGTSVDFMSPIVVPSPPEMRTLGMQTMATLLDSARQLPARPAVGHAADDDGPTLGRVVVSVAPASLPPVSWDDDVDDVTAVDGDAGARAAPARQYASVRDLPAGYLETTAALLGSPSRALVSGAPPAESPRGALASPDSVDELTRVQVSRLTPFGPLGLTSPAQAGGDGGPLSPAPPLQFSLPAVEGAPTAVDGQAQASLLASPPRGVPASPPASASPDVHSHGFDADEASQEETECP